MTVKIFFSMAPFYWAMYYLTGIFFANIFQIIFKYLKSIMYTLPNTFNCPTNKYVNIRVEKTIKYFREKKTLDYPKAFFYIKMFSVKDIEIFLILFTYIT